jgi:tetratricopeptide (TPR) repeat protein
VKILLDTNVLIAALISRGVCHELLEQCFLRHALFTSEFILSEMQEKLIDDNQPWPPRLVDKGEKAEKLELLKKKAAKNRLVPSFKSPEDLRGLVIHALGEFEKTRTKADDTPSRLELHRINIIPVAPQPYIAHPYSLLQTSQVVGRQQELNLLTDWVTTNKLVPASVRLFNLVAIGGMGKSALTWKWFNDIAPHELPDRAGWMWWSFYESDAHYENFIIRALAYTSGQTEEAVRELKSPEREDRLWHILNEQPFVLVLDGLERILLAYSRIDVARMQDADVDLQTANVIATGLPNYVRETYLEKHRLRQCADLRAGDFLRRLALVRASRVLMSTRLYPAELQTEAAQLLPGCHAFFLHGLTDSDALKLWHAFGVSGSAPFLLPIFNAFENYPLLLRALAGEVAHNRWTPGNFDLWRRDNPQFNPAALPLKNARTHVLQFALRGLGETQRHVLRMLAAFQTPSTWDTLSALLIGKESPCPDARALDAILTELEDRGLIGWDKTANRYDLHPIVRNVVWETLDPSAKRALFQELHRYFDATPKPKDWNLVENLDDLTSAIELYYTLVGLGRPMDAYHVFQEHLDFATLYRLSASRQRVELLASLCRDDGGLLQQTLDVPAQSFVLNALALAYQNCGEPGQAVVLYQKKIRLDDESGQQSQAAAGWRNITDPYRFSGQLRLAQHSAQNALAMSREPQDRFREAISLSSNGLVAAVCSDGSNSELALRRAKAILAATAPHQQGEGVVSAWLAQARLWQAQPAAALALAHQAWQLAGIKRAERDFVRAARLHGEAAVGLGDLGVAEEQLQHALTRARTVNFIEEELPALISLAEVQRSRKEFDAARELLEHVWIPAQRGPYPLWHADARNVLARIERDEGHRDAAIAAATRAYELAWCDGPPYAYHYGLTNAKQLLAELGAPEPELPPFDESKFEPMPEVEINPKDEFWVDPATLDSMPDE